MLFKNFILFVFLLTSFSAVKAQYKDDYSSWNDKRPKRISTKYIILHTTEAKDKSSLNSVKRGGTCNYIVMSNGTVYRIIAHNKLAKHAGRSMWCGVTNLSEKSIGIEVVGYHNKKPNKKQLAALKQLISDLRKIYPRIRDGDVLTHSMVAYGAPHKWCRTNHRGRKRCGMYFADKDVRKSLGLSNTFSCDPDVDAKRLTSEDKYLQGILYGGGKSNQSSKTIEGINEGKKEDEEAFEGFQEITDKGVYSIAGKEYKSKSTIYFFPSGMIRTGSELSDKTLNNLPKGTKVLVGYVYGGTISSKRSAWSIVKTRWNYPSTFYRFPDKTIHAGDMLNDSNLPSGTIVLFRQ